MVTGHQQSMLKDLQELLSPDSAKSMAKEAGAEGFKIIGSTCVGQDIQLRANHCEEIFAGHTGNNFTSEALLATGAVDLVVSEFNCTIPGVLSAGCTSGGLENCGLMSPSAAELAGDNLKAVCQQLGIPPVL